MSTVHIVAKVMIRSCVETNLLYNRGPTTRLGKPGFSLGARLLVPQMLLCGSAYCAGIYASGWVGK